MYVSISEATRMVGLKSRSTFYRHIKKKGISISNDDDGNPRVEVSELIRVYGNKVKSLEEMEEKTNSNKLANNTQATRQVKQDETPVDLKIEVEVLKERVKTIETERERERTHLENRVNDMKEALAKAQDITLLLEDKREGQGKEKKDIDTKVEKLEAVIEGLQKQNETYLKKEEERQRRLEERRRRLEKAQKQKEEEEAKKGFFQKLFR